MLRRDYISWWLRPGFLRSYGRKSNTLFAGPWVGEFGWELLNWQGFLRWLAPEYEEVIVSCRPGTEALYADFASRFEHHRVSGTAECNIAHDIQNPDELERIKALVPEDADHLETVGWQPDSRKRFIPFGEAKSELRCDVLFHARGRGFGLDRNWSEEKWAALVSGLNADGLTVACTGLTKATLNIEGEFVDHRDVPLDQTMDIMSSARLVVGPSSGPMHLASLCETPHVVWTDRKKYARGRTNRTKYERWWNPFDTNAFVIDHEGFDPEVSTVHGAILSALAETDERRPS